MTDSTAHQATRAAEIWGQALILCHAEGISPDVACLAMLECSCHALSASAQGLSGEQVRRIREEVWAELTLLEERCG